MFSIFNIFPESTLRAEREYLIYGATKDVRPLVSKSADTPEPDNWVNSYPVINLSIKRVAS
ncbi:uncharacterized protein PST29_2984 [Pseudomonas sp. St29]|nr:uncharacterized protein PST29_2984 [Pseudomonas sp. St29]